MARRVQAADLLIGQTFEWYGSRWRVTSRDEDGVWAVCVERVLFAETQEGEEGYFFDHDVVGMEAAS